MLPQTAPADPVPYWAAVASSIDGCITRRKAFNRKVRLWRLRVIACYGKVLSRL
jgi:hypothetical protein